MSPIQYYPENIQRFIDDLPGGNSGNRRDPDSHRRSAVPDAGKDSRTDIASGKEVEGNSAGRARSTGRR